MRLFEDWQIVKIVNMKEQKLTVLSPKALIVEEHVPFMFGQPSVHQ